MKAPTPVPVQIVRRVTSAMRAANGRVARENGLLSAIVRHVVMANGRPSGIVRSVTLAAHHRVIAALHAGRVSVRLMVTAHRVAMANARLLATVRNVMPALPLVIARSAMTGSVAIAPLTVRAVKKTAPPLATVCRAKNSVAAPDVGPRKIARLTVIVRHVVKASARLLVIVRNVTMTDRPSVIVAHRATKVTAHNVTMIVPHRVAMASVRPMVIALPARLSAKAKRRVSSRVARRNVAPTATVLHVTMIARRRAVRANAPPSVIVRSAMSRHVPMPSVRVATKSATVRHALRHSATSRCRPRRWVTASAAAAPNRAMNPAGTPVRKPHGTGLARQVARRRPRQAALQTCLSISQAQCDSPS